MKLILNDHIYIHWWLMHCNAMHNYYYLWRDRVRGWLAEWMRYGEIIWIFKLHVGCYVVDIKLIGLEFYSIFGIIHSLKYTTRIKYSIEIYRCQRKIEINFAQKRWKSFRSLYSICIMYIVFCLWQQKTLKPIGSIHESIYFNFFCWKKILGVFCTMLCSKQKLWSNIMQIYNWTTATFRKRVSHLLFVPLHNIFQMK